MQLTRRTLPAFTGAVTLLVLACERGPQQLTTPEPWSRQQKISAAATSLYVSSVEQLYAAVNNAANAGAAIYLAPGSYVLTSTSGSGAPRPNGGRLELQRDMSLYGIEDDRSAVVINASGLPASAFAVSFGRTGIIRIGRGSNSVEWLTIVGNPQAAASIATELTGTPETWVRVAHVTAGGSSRGVDVRNVGAAMRSRRINAELVDNEFIGPSEVVGMSEGIRLSNFALADSGVIIANMSRNRAHGFQLGCIIASNRSSNAQIHVQSSGDRYYGNTLGCEITGGLSQTTGVANNNVTTFEAHASQFVDNTADIPGIDPGGLHISAGLSTTAANTTSNNTVHVELWGVKISGNQVDDLAVFGAWKAAPPGVAGTNNHSTLILHGVSKQTEVVQAASTPTEPAGTNTVTVIR